MYRAIVTDATEQDLLRIARDAAVALGQVLRVDTRRPDGSWEIATHFCYPEGVCTCEGPAGFARVGLGPEPDAIAQARNRLVDLVAHLDQRAVAVRRGDPVEIAELHAWMHELWDVIAALKP